MKVQCYYPHFQMGIRGQTHLLRPPRPWLIRGKADSPGLSPADLLLPFRVISAESRSLPQAGRKTALRCGHQGAPAPGLGLGKEPAPVAPGRCHSGSVTWGSVKDCRPCRQVEEIVHDSIARNLLPFSNMLRAYDLTDTGLIGRNNFKKIMRIFCPFLPTEHLSK